MVVEAIVTGGRVAAGPLVASVLEGPRGIGVDDAILMGGGGETAVADGAGGRRVGRAEFWHGVESSSGSGDEHAARGIERRVVKVTKREIGRGARAD